MITKGTNYDTLIAADFLGVSGKKHMKFFDRFKKTRQQPDLNYARISALGDDPNLWSGLQKDELKQVLMVKCIEYGMSQDGGRIRGLFALYRHAMGFLDVEERLRLLTEFCQMTEQRRGEGHMGLMMFLAADNDRAVCSSAALSLSVLYDPDDEGVLAGPAFVIRSAVGWSSEPQSQGAALGGILLLGDKRVIPLLHQAWRQIGEEAQLEMTKVKSGTISEGLVEFWLGCLEGDCSQAVFGSVVAAIAKMPRIASVPFVVDLQRAFPVYSASEPMKLLRRTSFGDYLRQIRPRLEAICKREGEPKLIPRIWELWEKSSPIS